MEYVVVRKTRRLDYMKIPINDKLPATPRPEWPYL